MSRTRVVVELAEPVDLALLDALARLALCARRLGALLEVRAPEADLVELAGLSGVLQVLGQSEAAEQRGVEEVVDVGDPAV